MAVIDRFPLNLFARQWPSPGARLLRVALAVPSVTLAGWTAPLLADAALDGAAAKLASTSELSAAELEEARELDWVPLEELTEEQRERIPTGCCGAYIAPERTDADATLAPESSSLRASALESQTAQQTHIDLKGNVMITQGNRSVSADGASFDQVTRESEMSGNIQIREPGFLFRADKAMLNIDSGEARLDNTRFVLYETRIHGRAEYLQKFGDNIINLTQSEISSCEPGDNTWSIQGSEITLYPEKHYGTAENMRINIKDVPVIYMPYARFPVGSERLTGFLFPSISPSSGRDGVDVDLALPFYWNIAPNYDAVITPRYISNRGPVFELDTRHMSQLFDSEFKGSIINNDDGGYSNRSEELIKNGASEAEAYPYRGYDRWFYNFSQEGGRNQSWTSEINYSDISDRDYLRDMSSGSVDANREAYLRQMASFSYNGQHWVVGAKVDEYRLLTTSQLPYRELPRVNINGSYRINDAPGEDWVFKLNNEYVNFTKNRNYDVDTAASQLAYLDTIYGERLNTDYRLTWDKSVAWGFVKPSIAVKSLSYRLDKQNLLPDSDSPSFAVPQASLDSGLVFERNTSLFDNDYVQTFEPRVFYFYSAYKNQDALYNITAPNYLDTADTLLSKSSLVNFDTSELNFNYNQLFRSSRFAGGDRIDDANQVSLAVSSAFISQSTGVERLRVSLGQIFYGDNRKISIYDKTQLDNPYLLEANTRSRSPLALQLTGQVGTSLRLSADAAYDQRQGQVDNISTGLHYMDEQYRLFNVAYRYTPRPLVTSPSQPPVVEESLNQIDTSILWPVSNSWTLVARTNYDFHYNVELDSFVGFEYNDCCYRARLMWRRWLNFDYSPNFLKNVTDKDYEKSPYPFIELELKGLGSMSHRISSLLDKAVAGFSEREKNLR
ncbi:MAG TPA: LPS-assembly protein LptD [Cellvibrio sp.]|nr:LPS-assembly protein LptD [Cellvibrio sp.]